MSLNWNWTDDTKFEAFERDENGDLTDKESCLNDCFIWGTMTTGLNEITESNIEEWIVRAKMLSAASMALGKYNDPDKGLIDWIPLHEELDARIGLQTNATALTRAAFKKKIIKWVEQNAEKYAKRQVPHLAG